MMLPNLIIIGAMKCGTTALHQYLAAHPEIFMSARKEIDYFVEEINWGRGLDWYEAQFDSNAKIRGESSPNYTAFPHFRGVPERMKAVVPDARLIYLIRDPIERMVSHYVNSVSEKHVTCSIEEVLADPNRLYFYRSRYYEQLEQYLAYYDASNIMIVSSEELSRERAATLKRIFAFLGVDDSFWSDEFNRVIHESAQKRTLSRTGRVLRNLDRSVRRLIPIPAPARQAALRALKTRRIERPALSPATRERIAEHLADDVARLRAFTGKRFEDWSI